MSKKNKAIRKEVEEATFLDGQGRLIKRYGPGLDLESDATDDRNVASFVRYRWLPRLKKMKTTKEVADQVENFRSQVPSLGGTEEERDMQGDIDSVMDKFDASPARASSKTSDAPMSKSNDPPGAAMRAPGGAAMMVAAPVATIQSDSSRQGTLENIDPGFIHARTGKTYDQLYQKHRKLTSDLSTAVGGGPGLKEIHRNLTRTHDDLRDIEQEHEVVAEDRQFAKDTGMFKNKRYFRYLSSKDDHQKKFPSYTGGKFKGHHFDILAGGKRKTRKRKRKRKTRKHRKKKKTRRKPKKRHRRTRRH